MVNSNTDLESLAATGAQKTDSASPAKISDPSDRPWSSLGLGGVILSGSLWLGKWTSDQADNCFNAYGNVNCVPPEIWEQARRGLIHISEPFEPILPFFGAAVGTLLGASLIYHGLRGAYRQLRPN